MLAALGNAKFGAVRVAALCVSAADVTSQHDAPSRAGGSLESRR